MSRFEVSARGQIICVMTLPLPSPRPYRLSSVSVHPMTGLVTWTPPLPPEEAERRLVMARRLRAVESSSPWYNEQAKKSAAAGHHADLYSLGRYLSCVNLDLPPTEGSNTAPEYPTQREQIRYPGLDSTLLPADSTASKQPPPSTGRHEVRYQANGGESSE